MNNPCGCSISVISASTTYNADTTKSSNGNDFTSKTSDRLGPWFGEPTHFQGTNLGDTIVYDYQITCNISCWITSITIEGAAFANSDTLTFIDGNTQQQIGQLTSLSGGNTFQSHTLDLSTNPYYSKSFRLTESNEICCWRYRSLITMTMLIVVLPTPITQCNCIVSIINASAVYPIGTQYNVFTSTSIDPLGPWTSQSVQYRGTAAGGFPITYDYDITCEKSCWITSVNIVGSAFQNSELFLYNFDKSVLIHSYSVHTGNVPASHMFLMNATAYYSKQFRFVEINDISTWRYRETIAITVITEPTNEPTTVPTVTPSINPTVTPTKAPTLNPTYSDHPSTYPTKTPSSVPSIIPTMIPTKTPTINPTLMPTLTPSQTPSNNPTLYPSDNPSTITPTQNPTQKPTSKPTNDGQIRDDTTTEYYSYDSNTADEYAISENNNLIIYYIIAAIGFICLCICIICIIYGMRRKRKNEMKLVTVTSETNVTVNNNIVTTHSDGNTTTMSTNVTNTTTNTTINTANIDFAEIGSMSSSIHMSANENMLGNFAMSNDMMLHDVINAMNTPGYMDDDMNNNTEMKSSNTNDMNGEIDNEQYYNNNSFINSNAIEMIEMNNVITPNGYDNEVIHLDDDEFIINDDDDQVNEQEINGNGITKGNDNNHYEQDDDDDNLIVMGITKM